MAYLVHVDANGLASWADLSCGKKYIKPSAAAKVNDGLSLVDKSASATGIQGSCRQKLVNRIIGNPRRAM